jgi:WhiB family redox-sensing transcriptional regulator
MGFRESAACRTANFRLFFPADGEGQDQWRGIDAARDICDTCPVRVACLEDALRKEGNVTTSYRHGLWGGLTPTERYALTRRDPSTRTRDLPKELIP